MRWSTLALLAIVGITLQTALAPRVQIGDARPDWMLLLAVHYALLAPWPDALIAAWIFGLVVDLQSVNPGLGLFAVCYGGVTVAIIKLRPLVFREKMFSYAVFTLLAGFAVQAAVAVYRLWLGAGTVAGTEGLIGDAVAVAVYTALWAPLGHVILMKLGRATGLRRVQRFRAIGEPSA